MLLLIFLTIPLNATQNVQELDQFAFHSFERRDYYRL